MKTQEESVALQEQILENIGDATVSTPSLFDMAIEEAIAGAVNQGFQILEENAEELSKTAVNLASSQSSVNCQMVEQFKSEMKPAMEEAIKTSIISSSQIGQSAAGVLGAKAGCSLRYLGVGS